MFKKIVLLLFLFIGNTVHASKTIYFFSASWCGPCKQVKAWIHSNPEAQQVISQYDNWLLDVDDPDNQHAKSAYRVQYIPAIFIVDTYKDKDGKTWAKILYRWGPEQGQDNLLAALKKYAPKENVSAKRPLLRFLKFSTGKILDKP